MPKTSLTPQCLIPVRPILIVGANIGGKPNFFEVGGGGLVATDPPMIALPIRHPRYTLKGIMENRTFSVNVPSVEQAKEADYCGIVSGVKADKAKDCNFTVFYGKLKNAPMIEQCPVNMECTLMHILNSNSHAIVIGRVDGTFVSSDLVKDEKPDWGKITPLLWFPDKGEYLAPGKVLGKPHSLGSELKK